ncbi:MAG: hypothetical protein DRN25_00005, partial [Thermoplasmata archaeon]
MLELIEKFRSSNKELVSLISSLDSIRPEEAIASLAEIRRLSMNCCSLSSKILKNCLSVDPSRRDIKEIAEEYEEQVLELRRKADELYHKLKAKIELQKRLENIERNVMKIERDIKKKETSTENINRNLHETEKMLLKLKTDLEEEINKISEENLSSFIKEAKILFKGAKVCSQNGEELSPEEFFRKTVIEGEDFQVLGRGIVKDEAGIVARWIALKSLIKETRGKISKEIEIRRKRLLELEKLKERKNILQESYEKGLNELRKMKIHLDNLNKEKEDIINQLNRLSELEIKIEINSLMKKINKLSENLFNCSIDFTEEKELKDKELLLTIKKLKEKINILEKKVKIIPKLEEELKNKKIIEKEKELITKQNEALIKSIRKLGEKLGVTVKELGTLKTERERLEEDFKKVYKEKNDLSIEIKRIKKEKEETFSKLRDIEEEREKILRENNEM